MAIEKQIITDEYAIYQGDCIEGMKDLPDESIGLSVYSPPFATSSGGLYTYSSSERDLSNCDDYSQFFEMYKFVLKELYRITEPGRCAAVHCMDVPAGNSGKDYLIDFPGDIVRLHNEIGFKFIARHGIWKEPLAVRNRTMQKNLSHKTIVDDGVYGGVAGQDHFLIFRKPGTNKKPVTHSTGLQYYAGERDIPQELYRFKNWTGKQTENRFSHWIWRQYASSFWDDIRIDNVLKFKQTGNKKLNEDDERHVHPLQLDAINRVIALRSNPGDKVLTPFMGVGSEVYGAVLNGRKGIGFELKDAYFRQAIKNLSDIDYSIFKEDAELDFT